MTEGLFGFLRRKETKDPALPPDPLDSALIGRINSGEQAVSALANESITPTTRREVWDRLLRSAGRRAMKDPDSVAVFLKLQEEAQRFYGTYYLEGVDSLPRLDPDLQSAASGLKIESKNRNLASHAAEKMIKKSVENTLEQEASRADKPIIVSLAFGGTEPALVLNSRLQTDLIHLKPPPGITGETTPLWIGDPSILHNRRAILIEDAVKTGDTFSAASEIVRATGTTEISEVIIRDNPVQIPPK